MKLAALLLSTAFVALVSSCVAYPPVEPAAEAACHKGIAVASEGISEGHSYPVWSPDGQWIAFSSQSGGNFDIYLVRPDASQFVRLTDHPAIDAHPSWSPDGRWITFDSTRNGNRDGYVVAVSGCSEQPLAQSAGEDGTPAWHPGGQSVVFGSNREGRDLLYRAEAELSHSDRWSVGPAAPLAAMGAPNHAGSWSPDGRKLLFESRRDGNREIYIAEADGTDERNLTRNAAADFFGRWSPDGREILFWSMRTGNGDLFVMNADGSNLRQITSDVSQDRMPAWSPDGRKVVFQSDRDGGPFELYVKDLESERVMRLTCGLARCPTMRP